MRSEKVHGVDATPVKLHRTADAIGPRTENHDRVTGLHQQVVLLTMIGQIEIIRLGWILGCQGIDLLHVGLQAVHFPLSAHVAFRDAQDGTDLAVGKAGLFGFEE